MYTKIYTVALAKLGRIGDYATYSKRNCDIVCHWLFDWQIKVGLSLPNPSL